MSGLLFYFPLLHSAEVVFLDNSITDVLLSVQHSLSYMLLSFCLVCVPFLHFIKRLFHGLLITQPGEERAPRRPYSDPPVP